MNVLARLVLHGPNVLDVANDPRRLQGHVVERRGQDDMRSGLGEAGVLDRCRRGALPSERRRTVADRLTRRSSAAVARMTMAEYALILGGIAIVVILALVFLGGRIRDLFEATGSSVTTPVS